MSSNVKVIKRLNELPDEAKDGDTYFIEESNEYFTKPVYYVRKNGAWHIQYLT